MFVNQKKSRAREIIYGINAALTAIETAPEKDHCCLGSKRS